MEWLFLPAEESQVPQTTKQIQKNIPKKTNNLDYYNNIFNSMKFLKNKYMSYNKKEYLLHWHHNLSTNGETWGLFIHPPETSVK